MKHIVLLFFLTSQVFAQTVEPLPVSIINAALLTANFATTNNTIEISNVSIMANDSTIGLFQGFTGYPVSDGLILSTGGAEWGLTGSSTATTGPYASPSMLPNPYLYSLSSSITQSGGATTYNNFICVEFDFVPQFDAIDFQYIFASTEYLNYTCSQYNDLFGFFLTGPGISGSFYNGSKNIATVPGSNGTPVCINSINSGNPSGGNTAVACNYVDTNFLNYTSLFNSNNPWDSGHVDFPFNGYTESLSISDSLMPDSTYHLKIIISDVGDHLFNSAVFLNANSFTSYPIDSTMWGCMDSTALNYNMAAVFDDGSCIYQNIDLYEIEDMKDILSHISNPISGNILEIPELEAGMEVSIYNSAGNRLIISQSTNTDISNLDGGIYILEISNGTHRTSGKFIKL